MKRLIASVVILLVVSVGADAESPRPVKGTHVILTAPKGFVVADRFPGFMSEETGASIMVSELPAPFTEVTKDFNAGGFKKQGMTLLSQTNASYGAHNGVLISAAQSARGVDFLKWLAVFGDDKTTYLVTASFPKEEEKDLSDVLKKSLTSARLSATDADPIDALTFRVSPTNDMKIAKIIGNGILLSKGGLFPAKSIDTPIFVVGASASKGLQIPDKKVFAESRLQKVATLRDVQVKTTEPIAIGGLDGYESTADALDADGGSKMIVYQVVLFDVDGYYAMQGIATEGAGKVQLPTMKLIARSFRKTVVQP
jgi:hypothetical protein